MLTVIAIIGVIASILIPTISKIRATSQRTHCASNLRQIGIGINLYANEHEGVLPGGLNEGQNGLYKGESSGSLAAFIAPYVDGTLYKSGVSLKNELFVCPSWEALRVSGVCYAMNMRVPIDGGDTWIEPFGRATGSKKPIRLYQISDPLPNVPAIYEVDRKNIKANGGPIGQSATWDPVHGNVRNVLYFDGSVRTENVD
ncbi:DUF1559 domain-containing protein [Ruficoccus amylovorans]|uniref:DUF1559 domain-containing protein n=2 Tax=Ruficoccus amylovorans TaxID=1804625 RepID=A0A842HM10_9BACT|nr:DUF1559 domain-containing protein [Ruficoccus amylovorans]MBC2596141.1 DUF1559 domain-containing protein [Ruficoccus amylovorans]